MANRFNMNIPLAAFISGFLVYLFITSGSKEHSSCNCAEVKNLASANPIVPAVIAPTCPEIPQALRSPVYLGDFTIMCHSPYQDRYFFLDTRDKGLMPHICAGRPWEMEVTNAFENTVQPGWTVLDIGANYGWYSFRLAHLVGATGRVISLEAQPRTFSLVNWAIEVSGLSGTVTVVNKAAYSVTNETVKMSFIPDRPLNNALLVDGMTQNHVPDAIVSVRTTTINDLVKDHKLTKVDFMKVDVEGVEDSVWDGMQDVLNDNPKIILFMEVNTARMGLNSRDAEKFYRKIEKRFPVIRHVSDGGILRVITVEQMLKYLDGDLFLTLFPE